MNPHSPSPSNSRPERVLVLVLSYNGSRYLGDCLSSLRQTLYPKDAFEILVVDNGSTDDSVALIRRDWPEVRIIENGKNLGFAGGNNIGLIYAVERDFDYVYLLNQDTVVTPGFLVETVKAAGTDPAIGAIQSKLLLFDDPGRINTIGNEIHYLGFGFAGGYRTLDRDLDTAEIPYGSGACVLLRVSALKDVGLFNEDFFLYQEDLDLGWRLRLAGYRILRAPRSVVYHKYEFSRHPKKYYYLERNRHLILLQNYKPATWLVIGIPLLVMQIGVFFYSLIAGFWREELKVYAYFCHVENWRKALATRRQVQKKRRVADRDVVKFFTGKVEFEDLRNPILKYIANPIFNAYWQVAKRLIQW